MAILAMEFTTLSMSAVSPALANIGNAFPDIPHVFLSMLLTIPPLVSMPFTILSNRLVRQSVPFRMAACIGFLFLLSGGIGPYFSNNFYVILMCRILFGVGMGFILPMGTTIVYTYFNKEEAEIQCSNDIISNNLGAILFQLLGGILCSSFGWHATFLVYIMLLPSFMIVLFLMPEPGKIFAREAEEKVSKTKAHYGWNLWKWCFLYFLFCVLFYPLITDSPEIIERNGYGTAAGTAVMLVLFTVGGMLGGFAFRLKPLQKMKQRIFSFIFVICALGFAIIMLSDRLAMMIVGAGVFGIGYGIFMAAVIVFAGYSVPQDIRPGVTARMIVSAGAGEFSSAFIMLMAKNLFHSSYERFSFALSIAVFLILSIVFFVKHEAKRKMESTE